jgi:hypothetical protein
MNVPIGVGTLLLAAVMIEESRDTSVEQRPDVPGLAASGVGLFALTYGFIETNTYGWSSGRIVGGSWSARPHSQRSSALSCVSASRCRALGGQSSPRRVQARLFCDVASDEGDDAAGRSRSRRDVRRPRRAL